MLSSLFMAAFAAQVADDGFSKLQIFLQQLIDWGVSAGGRIIGAVIIFVVGRFLISFLRKMLARLLAKRHVEAQASCIGRAGQFAVQPNVQCDGERPDQRILVSV